MSKKKNKIPANVRPAQKLNKQIKRKLREDKSLDSLFPFLHLLPVLLPLYWVSKKLQWS